MGLHRWHTCDTHNTGIVSVLYLYLSLGGLVIKLVLTQIISDTRTERVIQCLCALWDTFFGALGWHINSLASHPESTRQRLKVPMRRKYSCFSTFFLLSRFHYLSICLMIVFFWFVYCSVRL